MKKIFSLLAALALTSLANAEIYEVGEGNDNTISISVPTEAEDGYIPVEISLTNPTASIIGMDIYVEFSGGKLWDEAPEVSERCIDTSGRKPVTTHTIVTGYNSEDKFLLGLNSASNAFVQGTEGTIITAYIDARNLADGQYSIKLSNSICFNLVDKYRFAESEYVFTYANGTVTGINTISADAQNAKYYSVNGAIQNGPQKGVNIVKYANGEVKKVIVK